MALWKMPSVASIFRKTNRTRPSHTCPGEAEKRRRKKRTRFFSNSRKLDELVGDDVPSESSQRPQRPLRDELEGTPELPSLPIYQTFTSKNRLISLTNEEKHGVDREWTQWRGRRQGLSDRYARVTSDSNQTEPREPASVKANNVATTPHRDPVAYDRAEALAKSYRSVLPDLAAMWSDEVVNTFEDKLRIHRAAGHRQQHHHQQHQHNHHQHHQPSIPPHRMNDGWATLPKHPSAQPNPTPSTSSSLTAVETSNSSQHAPSHSSTSHPRATVGGRPASSEHWPLPGPPTTVAAATPQPLFTPRHRSRRARLCQPHQTPLPPPPHSSSSSSSSSSSFPSSPASSSPGLQICTELLTDELARAMSLRRRSEGRSGGYECGTEDGDDDNGDVCPSEGLVVGHGIGGGGGGGGGVGLGSGLGRRRTRGRAVKLQVLMMIEAYEVVLESCRREVRVRRDGSGDFRDAVGILEHWVHSLYAIYDEAFGEEAGE